MKKEIQKQKKTLANNNQVFLKSFEDENKRQHYFRKKIGSDETKEVYRKKNEQKINWKNATETIDTKSKKSES